MQSARADRKPCTIRGCPGTMQFGWRPNGEPPKADASRAASQPAPESPGWICSREPCHFYQPMPGDLN